MRWEPGSEGDKELETVVEEDEGCSSVKSVDAILSASNLKRPREMTCCIHSVTLKQPPPSRCCAREEENNINEGGGSSRSHQACVMNCTDVSVDERRLSPQGSVRSCDGDAALESVATPGTYGEINVQHSSDVHFGNKIFTAPITVVNQMGGADDTEFVVDNGSFKGGTHKCSNISYRTTFLNVTTRARSTICGPVGRNILTAFYFLLVVGLSVGLIVAVIRPTEEEQPETTLPPPTVPNDKDIYFNETWFYTREDWKGRTPSVVIKFPQKLDFVIISHTHVLSLVCKGHMFCSFYIRLMQQIQMANRLHDISYNYIISSESNGALYVGRGANVEGEHTPGYNAKSLGIAFIGDYNTREPNPNQLNHAKLLIEEAVKLGKLSDRYKLVGQGQLLDTDSPGKNLMKEIQTWDHWVEFPTYVYFPPDHLGHHRLGRVTGHHGLAMTPSYEDLHNRTANASLSKQTTNNKNPLGKMKLNLTPD